MDEAVGVVVGAGESILQYGAIGGMLLLSLAANVGQWWYGRKDRKRYTDHLESHYGEVEK